MDTIVQFDVETMTPEDYGHMALEFGRQKDLILKNLMALTRTFPMKVRNHSVERRRQVILCEPIAEHLAFHRVMRDGGKVRWFTINELGRVLYENGVLDMKPVKQAWTRLKTRFGSRIKVL
jgi:hypothetical protein